MIPSRLHERVGSMNMVCVGGPAHGRWFTIDDRTYTFKVPLQVGVDEVPQFPWLHPTPDQNREWYDVLSSRAYVFDYKVESFYYAGCSMTFSGFALRYHELNKHDFPAMALSLIIGGMLMSQNTPSKI